MTTLKQSVASLMAFFEKKPLEAHSQCNNTKNNGNSMENSTLKPELKADLDTMALEFWKELLRHAQQSKIESIDKVLSSVGGNVKDNLAVSVSTEVHKRELLATLEAIHKSLKNQCGQGKGSVSEDQVSIISLKRRLGEISEKARNAKEDLHLAKKETHDLEYVCAEYEERNEKLSKSLYEARTENRELKAHKKTLLETTKVLESRVQRLQTARVTGEVEALQAIHKAEMAELVATQASLRCMNYHKQLREAKCSSHAVQEHLDGLERVLDEMKILLTSSSSTSESSSPRRLKRPLELLVRKGSKLLGRVGASVFRSRNETDMNGRNDQEWVSETDIRATNEHGDDALAPYSESKQPKVQVSRSNDQHERRSQTGLFQRKKTGKVCHVTKKEEDGGPAANENLENGSAPKSGRMLHGLLSRSNTQRRRYSPPRLFQKLTSRLRHLTSGSRSEREAIDNLEEQINQTDSIRRGSIRVDSAETEVVPNLQEGPTNLAEFKRILSLGSNPKHGSRLQARDPLAFESLSKTLKSLEKNLNVLRDVVNSKEEDVQRLQSELREATKLSDEFEQDLKKELHKRLEMEKILTAKEQEIFPVEEDLYKSERKNSSIRGKVIVESLHRLV
ncbi:unnamed protein product [Agarophyton chilense]